MGVFLTNVFVGVATTVLFIVFLQSVRNVGRTVGNMPAEQRLLRKRSILWAWTCIILTCVVSIVAFAAMTWNVIGAALAGVAIAAVEICAIRGRTKRMWS